MVVEKPPEPIKPAEEEENKPLFEYAYTYDDFGVKYPFCNTTNVPNTSFCDPRGLRLVSQHKMRSSQGMHARTLRQTKQARRRLLVRM
jgi:hypothetical protein